MTDNKIDPVALGVMWDRLIAIADDILLSIIRTSFSVGVREAWDLAVMLFDAEGRSIAQATLSMPAFIGTAPYTMRHLLAKFPADTLQPGDVLATNDPWLGTGHTPDVCVARPVFFDGRLVGFVMTISHLPDIGGNGLTIANTEIYQEGLVLPPCKLQIAGERNEALWELIGINVRAADQVLGDLMADIGGTAVGERLLGEFMREFALRDLTALSAAVIGQSEKAMRERLRTIPDGVYTNELMIEGVETDVKLSCRVTVTNGTAAVDFAGTGGCVPAAINVPLCYTRSFTNYVMKCLTTPDIPNNEGMLSPITVSAPEGCILNAVRPNPTGGRHTVGWFIVPLIMGALAKVLPNNVAADAGMASLFLVHGTRPDGRPVTAQYFLSGGLGAMQQHDAHQTTPFPTNNAVVSTEVFETETGATVMHRRLLPDSGGAGEWRGGLGQEAALRNDTGHPFSVFLFGLRSRHAARGLFGGKDGQLRSFMVDGVPIPAKGKSVLQPGQTLTVREAGGGGYGDPKKRAPEAVRKDVAAGFVSPAAALRDYGLGV